MSKPFDNIAVTKQVRQIRTGEFQCKQTEISDRPHGLSINVTDVDPDQIRLFIGMTDDSIFVDRETAGVLAEFFTFVHSSLVDLHDASNDKVHARPPALEADNQY